MVVRADATDAGEDVRSIGDALILAAAEAALVGCMSACGVWVVRPPRRL